MAISIEILEAELLRLPAEERAYLLDRIIASLDSDSAVREAWIEEAARRDAEVQSGKVQIVSGAQLIARLREALQ